MLSFISGWEEAAGITDREPLWLAGDSRSDGGLTLSPGISRLLMRKAKRRPSEEGGDCSTKGFSEHRGLCRWVWLL